MTLFSKTRGILYLYRQGFVLYPEAGGAGVSVQFTDQAVWKEEILDREALRIQVKSLVVEKKIIPRHIVIVLSREVLFEKKIAAQDVAEQQNETKSFLDEIPFERIGKKIFRVENAFSVIATNADLYQVLKSSFEGLGWVVDAALPVVLFGKIGINNTLNPQEQRTIFSRPDLIRAGDFLIEDVAVPVRKDNDKKSQINGKRLGKRTIILIAVFFVLLCVLAFFVYTNIL